MKMGAFMMGCGLLVCGLDLMPFWFMKKSTQTWQVLSA